MNNEPLKKKSGIRMIDVTDKKKSQRMAIACVKVFVSPQLLKKIKTGKLLKGDCLAAAQAAGILAAKKTPGLIPLCHPIAISHIAIDFIFLTNALKITAVVKALDATGVEMEALAACAVAALTIYDMAKAHEPGIEISDLKLIKKTGGKNNYCAKDV